ncbi:MAG: polysulfide reductase NrfD [Chloroflexi bacterium]|nr:polysulfide reductase NrfD [Chloroflexota bacterium]
MSSYTESVEDRILAPLTGSSRPFWIWVGVLLAIVAWGGVAYSIQAREGLVATGMRDRIMWGLYVTLFVMFIGASMAGTFVSAVLRLTGASWRGPIVRSAEMVTVAALVVAALFIFFDMGRPERALNIVLFGRWESPLVWDVYGLATYLAGSLLYLYLAAIPDIAMIRDLVPASQRIRSAAYKAYAVNWVGTPEQRRVLLSTLGLMAIIMVPVAVMMHTVTSWIFGMTLREPWNSPMFGIFFVGGAIYSGIGLIAIMMLIVKKVYRLNDLITDNHFLKLGYLLATFAALMVFFNVSEFVTLGYKTSVDASFYISQMTRGSMAPIFWIYIWGGLILPIILIAVPKTRNTKGIVIASIAANVGMLLERYFIVIGGLTVPLNPYEPASYFPTWIEWSLMLAGVAIFALIITALAKALPIVAIWELREHEHELEESKPNTSARVTEGSV